MQTREGELRFGLDAHGGQGPKAESVRASPGMMQQRRFPDPGFARNHQRGAAVRETLDQGVDARCLDVAPDQLSIRQANSPQRHLTSICAWFPRSSPDATLDNQGARRRDRDSLGEEQRSSSILPQAAALVGVEQVQARGVDREVDLLIGGDLAAGCDARHSRAGGRRPDLAGIE